MHIKQHIPILQWLPNYKRSWLKNDLFAGMTIGVILIPQGIAYAIIAGLPPIYGLYTAMIPQIVYAILGTSRQLAVGPAAMDSLIVAAGISVLAGIGSEHFIVLAVLLAFMVGFFQVIFGLFHLGFLVNFLSKPVISGFTTGSAIIIGMNQFGKLFLHVRDYYPQTFQASALKKDHPDEPCYLCLSIHSTCHQRSWNDENVRADGGCKPFHGRQFCA